MEQDEPAILTRILTAGGTGDRVLPLLRLAPARWCLLRLERLLLPGIITHYLARKRQIEAHVERSIRAGCERVVVLGAGYDTLCWRLHGKHPGVRFIELDHPATQQVKREALGSSAGLRLQPIDLASELPATALGRIESERDCATTFVIEGLTMYLPPQRVASLMRDVANCAGPAGSIVFTFMERDARGSIGFRGQNPLVARWLKARSEPFLWGIEREELPGFLRSNGLELAGITDHDQLRREHLLPRGIDQLPLAEGELIATATPLPQ